MRVPPELTEALAPALAWAHENPDQGDKVLGPVERFVALYFREQARPAQPEQFATLRPADPLRRAYEAVTEQFTKARGDFLGDAADIGGGAGVAPTGGAAKDAGVMDTGRGPDALSQQADEMAYCEDLLDVLLAMPKNVPTLDAFKSHPIGGIQRHVNILLVQIESPIKSPARDEAAKQLFDLSRLATVADELASQPFDSIPPSIADAYTGSQLAAVQTKWKLTVTDLATAFSVNQPMDIQKLDRLRSLQSLLEALGPAQEMETAFAKPQPLAKWADWTVPADQVHALIAPYQQAMAQAFGGFVSDSPDAISQFQKMRHHFEPVMALIARTASFAPACDALPEGTTGLLSRLATPYDKAPFSEQRFTSLIAARCASGDATALEAAATIISQHAAP
jgi:hypothetical protein